MLQPLDNMPAGVTGFRAVGVIEPDDYKSVLDPVVDAAVEAGESLRMVYVIGDDFDRYSIGALWQDAKLGGKSLKAWGRIALVTDHDWIAHAMSVFSFAVRGEVKVFPLAEQDAAVAWAASEELDH